MKSVHRRAETAEEENHIQTDSFKYKIDKENMAVHIGSDYWNAIYEEFGTGEHAINGDGRKGYWIFVKSNGAPKPLKGGKNIYQEGSQKNHGNP